MHWVFSTISHTTDNKIYVITKGDMFASDKTKINRGIKNDLQSSAHTVKDQS